MRTVSFRVALILVLVSAFAPNAINSQTPPQRAASQAIEPRRDAHVIMISIDGLVPEYYTAPAPLGLRVPNLVKMKLGGAYADGVEGVYPSVTYPAHTTLITGVKPAIHGIIQNRIFEAPTEPQTREWYWFASALKSETLWGLAKKAGLVTAAVGWPVTVGAEIGYNMPEIFDPSERPPTPKRTLQYTTPELAAKLPGLPYGGDTSTDGRRTTVSEYIIKTHKPNLMLIHLIDLDSAHHRYGARSPEGIQTAEREDGYIGRIIEATKAAGTFDKTTFVLVSDHGFADVKSRFEPGVVLVKEKLITLDANNKPVDWKAAVWPAGGSCAIVLRDPNDKETAAKVARTFERIAQRNNGPLNRVLAQNELKRLGAIPSATLMLEAAPGFAFGDELTGPEVHEAKDYRGTHGHLPTRPELRAALIVYGAASRVGSRMSLARMIDIAPTAAAVLGLSFADAEGSPIRELIREGIVPPTPSKKKADKK
jgi:predicted AlkP superfamily pyrophosphatase or phosphodiesterase